MLESSGGGEGSRFGEVMGNEVGKVNWGFRV